MRIGNWELGIRNWGLLLLAGAALAVGWLGAGGESLAFESPVSPLPTPTPTNDGWVYAQATPTATPVAGAVPAELPEPTTLALLGGGLVALAAWRRWAWRR